MILKGGYQTETIFAKSDQVNLHSSLACHARFQSIRAELAISRNNLRPAFPMLHSGSKSCCRCNVHPHAVLTVSQICCLAKAANSVKLPISLLQQALVSRFAIMLSALPTSQYKPLCMYRCRQAQFLTSGLTEGTSPSWLTWLHTK